MLCKSCLTETVEWKGPLTALTHTECSSCGETNCQIAPPQSEGDLCPTCGNPVEYEPVENCSCHISPPCSACTSVRLMCTECEEFFE